MKIDLSPSQAMVDLFQESLPDISPKLADALEITCCKLSPFYELETDTLSKEERLSTVKSLRYYANLLMAAASADEIRALAREQGKNVDNFIDNIESSGLANFIELNHRNYEVKEIAYNTSVRLIFQKSL